MEMMKKIIAISIIIIAFGVAYWLFGPVSKISNFEDCVNAGYPIMESYPRQCKTPDGRTFTEIIPSTEPQPIGPNTKVFTEPPEFKERITKKPFGIKISPENSPISPERFSGYHTGIDYETFENEQNIDVEIFAICSGKLLRKERISGYGGVVIQECELEGQPVTVLYGHIQLNSVEQEPGEHIFLGDSLALLGEAFSKDTDNERKHLHLGIHKGVIIDIRGYVQNESELENWIDFIE